MSDPEKQPLNSSKQGEEDEGKEPEKGCCDKFAECIVETCKIIYTILVSICTAIRDCIACFWYPIKEQCCSCIDSCDKCLNPWKDPSFSQNN